MVRTVRVRPNFEHVLENVLVLSFVRVRRYETGVDTKDNTKGDGRTSIET